jgi:hypothetical protein
LIATYPSKEQADSDLTDALTTLNTAVSDHVSDADPHAQYLKESEYEAHRSREDLLKQATLSLDFTNNKYEVYEGPVNSLTQIPFNEALDFTRASSATARIATGKIQEVLTDEQRLVGNREGLLIEESRTNLVTYSEQFDNAAWDKDDVSITADNAIAPDGMTTADLMQATASAGVVGVRGNEGIATIGQDYVFSIYGKEGSAPYLLINPNATAFSGGGAFAGFDLSLGVVLEVGGSSLIRNTYIEKAANGFFRCSLVVEADTAGALMLRSNPYSVAGSLVSPSIGDNVHIWGAQVEEGSYPSSYIPTAGAQVTRAADDCVRMLGDELNANEGTIYTRVKALNKPEADSVSPVLIGLSSASSNVKLLIGYLQGSGDFFIQTPTGFTNSGVDATLGYANIAVAFRGGSILGFINGLKVYEESYTVEDFNGPMHIGSSVIGSNTNASAIFKSAFVLPAALSEAELITLTGGN